MKKILYITSLSGVRVNGFMESAIVAAKSLNFEFTLVANFENANLDYYKSDCDKFGISLVHINFNRNPISIKNIFAYHNLKQYLKNSNFDIIHCNTPIGGLIGRFLGVRNKKIKVIYQAHGFHFWRGAPFINWILFYPVELFLAKFTDVLIVINKEDYTRALNFKLKEFGKLYFINGVGVHGIPNKLSQSECIELKKEIGIKDKKKVFISVGELNDNKNHIVVIEALSGLNRSDYIYLICGKGKNELKLRTLVMKKGIENNVKFLGFRSDIYNLLQISDVFVFPSKREGLSVALMEAMECGLPCIASRIRGNVDLLSGSNLLFNLKDIEELTYCLNHSFDSVLLLSEGTRNKSKIKKYEFNYIVDSLKEIYSKLI